jgi:Phage integrase family
VAARTRALHLGAGSGVGALPYYAGLRISEVVGLDVDDVQLSARKGSLRILGKGRGGGRLRQVPVHTELRAILRAWLDERAGLPGLDGNPALFPGRHGKGRLTDRAARGVITGLGEGLVDEDFGPHTLRHTFATQLVRAGVDLVVVAELLGHARPDTTRRYSLPTDADRAAALDKLLVDHRAELAPCAAGRQTWPSAPPHRLPFLSASQRSNSTATMRSSCTPTASSDASQTMGGPITAGPRNFRPSGTASRGSIPWRSGPGQQQVDGDARVPQVGGHDPRQCLAAGTRRSVGDEPGPVHGRMAHRDVDDAAAAVLVLPHHLRDRQRPRPHVDVARA